MTPAERVTVFLLYILSAACAAASERVEENWPGGHPVQVMSIEAALTTFGYWIACEAEAIECSS